MRSNRIGQTWWVRTAAAGAVLLALGIGLCLFDADGHLANGHATSPDLCLAMIIVSVVTVFLAGRLAGSWALLVPVMAPYTVTIHIPDPPPKSLSLS
jgi:hypothetical protein